MKSLLFLLFLTLMINVQGQVSISTDGSLPDNSPLTSKYELNLLSLDTHGAAIKASQTSMRVQSGLFNNLPGELA